MGSTIQSFVVRRFPIFVSVHLRPSCCTFSNTGRIMVKLLFLTILGCLLACNALAETKKSENENRQMSLADMMNEFKNSYSANRGKRDISEEEEFEDDEITEDELDELMGRYFNPNGFFFQPGKRSNPNSMIFMPKRSNPNSMIFMPKRDTIYMPRPNGMIMGKRGGPNSMIFMPKRFNPNSMILLPKRSNPNSMIFMPKRADDVAKRETDLDEFFTSRGKKSWLMPKPVSRGYSAKATFSAARG